MDNRYLTLGDKHIELVRLATEEFVEPDLRPWLNRLNKLDGVCTLQSCGGHRFLDRENKSDETHIMNGHLWIWLSESVSRVFYTRAFELVQSDPMECVSIMFQGYGREIVSISFKGRAHNRMAESLDGIVEFFEEFLGERNETD